MSNNWVTYNFKPENKTVLVFIPGYTGGLTVPIIQGLIDFFVQDGRYDVFGLPLAYAQDIPDGYHQSQKDIVTSVNDFVSAHPEKKIVIIGKSLGGSLCLHNMNTLAVSGMIVLGSSVVLGWPQRISLLSNQNAEIPDYKSEWQTSFEQINTPVCIISGEKDDLSDNIFLESIANKDFDPNPLFPFPHFSKKEMGYFLCLSMREMHHRQLSL